MGNKIEQAYEQGLRVRCSYWIKKCWIKKHSETETIDEVGCISDINWNFKTNHYNWEIYHEDEHLFKLPDTLPETLIINGVKYKRDDN